MKAKPQPHYPMVIEWSDEDQVFVVTFPDLPGCMAHGRTPEVAAREGQVAMGLWLEAVREMGQPVPVPTRHRLSS